MERVAGDMVMEDMRAKEMNAKKHGEVGSQVRRSAIRQARPQAAGDVRDLLAAGQIAVIPTDTVYGIIADPRSQTGLDRLFAAKQRPRAKTVQILCSDVSQARKLGLIFPRIYCDLLAEFPEGSVCLVCPVKDDCQLVTTRQEDGYRTQAVRFPASQQAKEIISLAGAVAASSANRSGDQSATTVKEAVAKLGDSVPLYLDGGATPGPVASTVITVDEASMRQIRDGSQPTKPQLRILRQGTVAESDIQDWLESWNGRA